VVGPRSVPKLVTLRSTSQRIPTGRIQLRKPLTQTPAVVDQNTPVNRWRIVKPSNQRLPSRKITFSRPLTQTPGPVDPNTPVNRWRIVGPNIRHPLPARKFAFIKPPPPNVISAFGPQQGLNATHYDERGVRRYLSQIRDNNAYIGYAAVYNFGVGLNATFTAHRVVTIDLTNAPSFNNITLDEDGYITFGSAGTINNSGGIIFVNGPISFENAIQVAGAPGVSGSFTTVDGKTITVSNGIITSIV
jgi:hypothetical protein